MGIRIYNFMPDMADIPSSAWNCTMRLAKDDKDPSADFSDNRYVKYKDHLEAVAEASETHPAVGKIKRFEHNPVGMLAAPSGGWVLFNEVKTRFKDEVAKASQEPKEFESTTSYFMGVKDEGKRFAEERAAIAAERESIKAERARTNQLLNELYHDRARLERVVADAVHLLSDIQEAATKSDWENDEGERVDDQPIIGSVQQFVDTHGDT